MKSLAQIHLHYEKAIRQAEQLEETAGKLRSLAENDFQGCLQSLSAGWKGENAEAYMRKAGRLRAHIKASAAALQQISGIIRSIAKRTRAADMAAREIALAGGE